MHRCTCKVPIHIKYTNKAILEEPRKCQPQVLVRHHTHPHSQSAFVRPVAGMGVQPHRTCSTKSPSASPDHPAHSCPLPTYGDHCPGVPSILLGHLLYPAFLLFTYGLCCSRLNAPVHAKPTELCSNPSSHGPAPFQFLWLTQQTRVPCTILNLSAPVFSNRLSWLLFGDIYVLFIVFYPSWGQFPCGGLRNQV